MRNRISVLAAIAIALTMLGGSSAMAQSASTDQSVVTAESPGSGPAPSTWQLDKAGQVVAIAHIVETNYDGNGTLQEFTLSQLGRGGQPLTIKYTIVAGKKEGTFDMRSVGTLGQGDSAKILFSHYREDVGPITLTPYFFALQPDGRKSEVGTEEALRADPRTILGGIHIKGKGIYEAMPMFVGSEYAKHIAF